MWTTTYRGVRVQDASVPHARGWTTTYRGARVQDASLPHARGSCFVGVSARVTLSKLNEIQYDKYVKNDFFCRGLC